MTSNVNEPDAVDRFKRLAGLVDRHELAASARLFSHREGRSTGRRVLLPTLIDHLKLLFLEIAMNRFIRLARWAICALTVTSGQCYANILYVNNNGALADCSYTSPCGSMSHALSIATPGDTIICVAPPPIGSLTINKSITIDCSAARAATAGGWVNTSSSTTASILIDIANSTSDPLRVVRLKGLTFDGFYQIPLSRTSNRFIDRAIEVRSAAALFVEDCVIQNYKSQGIFDNRSGGQTRLYVKDTVVSNTGGPGIVVVSQSPAVTVLDNVSLFNNAYGLAAAPGNNVVITRSTISGNTTAGIHTDAGARINLTNSVLSNNTTNVNANGAVLLRENDIFFSNTAIVGGGAVSLGANRFSGNAAIGATPSLASGAQADVFY